MNEKSGDPETRSRLSAQRRDTVRKEQRSGMAGFAGLVVPQYLLDDAATSVKPLRPLLDWIGTKPIPESGGTVELSRYTTGAVGSAQVADNTALTQVDPVAAALSVPVRTPNVSIKTSWQVLDRLSVASQAEIILEMMEALATIVDTFVVSGSGVSGQPTGLATQAGSTSVTYVSGTPTVAALMLKLGALATQTSLARKRPVDTFVMHSRRWFWIVANVDAAVSHQVGPGQTLFGLPVIIDDNITTTGGGGNEDVVIAFRASDLRIYESEPHVFVDTQSGAGTGSANLIVYQYLAVAAGRYPAGIGLLTGTGLGGAVLS